MPGSRRSGGLARGRDAIRPSSTAAMPSSAGLSTALGMPPRMITNDKGRVSRYTDRETIDAMLMTYCGKVNKTIVATFQQARDQCGRPVGD